MGRNEACDEKALYPSSYRRDLRNRLQILKQGSISVDEYFEEMELLLIRSDIREDEESRMVRFLHGLNDDIQVYRDVSISNFARSCGSSYSHRGESLARTWAVLWESICLNSMAPAAARCLCWWCSLSRCCN
jgi:hypothetical protein